MSNGAEMQSYLSKTQPLRNRKVGSIHNVHPPSDEQENNRPFNTLRSPSPIILTTLGRRCGTTPSKQHTWSTTMTSPLPAAPKVVHNRVSPPAIQLEGDLRDAMNQLHETGVEGEIDGDGENSDQCDSNLEPTISKSQGAELKISY